MFVLNVGSESKKRSPKRFPKASTVMVGRSLKVTITTTTYLSQVFRAIEEIRVELLLVGLRGHVPSNDPEDGSKHFASLDGLRGSINLTVIDRPGKW